MTLRVTIKLGLLECIPPVLSSEGEALVNVDSDVTCLQRLRTEVLDKSRQIADQRIQMTAQQVSVIVRTHTTKQQKIRCYLLIQKREINY